MLISLNLSSDGGLSLPSQGIQKP